MKRLAALILLMSSPAFAAPPDDIGCMARAVYHESRGEPVLGQIAVAFVVLNRMRAYDYPTTACGVIYQPAQFTNLTPYEVMRDKEAWHRAVWISAYVWGGYLKDPTNGGLWFYNPDQAENPNPSAHKRVRIGRHVFEGN